eukprot:NODE_6328_length_899_cov_10.220361_g5736_i0.p1 GENE.NODE_6328_length_899_cov_10.220361_g5736_i0~~NODE_6328_length_899_cov_10.220361_g5736_i0.p1  ORF type:complete len:245 (-),score=52.08 NODE_6328_length_899_cov_10.220361_g5736_i0:61-795(-)
MATFDLNTPEALGVQENLKELLTKINEISKQSGREIPPRLVAVSKLKDASLVQAAYIAGQKYFGENYVQELVDKASILDKEIRWHFIGHLQSNKVKQLIQGVPHLSVIETVDSPKLADKLNASVAELGREPLQIYIQINTSGEESKSGIDPGHEIDLAKYIVDHCPHLKLSGLMTIGMPDYTSTPANFECLKQCRRNIAQSLDIDETQLELSMGMSGDYASAIEMGSTNIRVGSAIFGARPPKH